MRKFVPIVFCLSSLLYWSCDEPDLFSEYDDENFLSATSFQNEDWTLMPDYTFETGTSADDYMGFSEVSAAGGPAGGPVFRLEIKNLLSNGDFNNSSTDATPWFLYDEATPQIVDPPGTNLQIISSGSYILDANTVDFSALTNFRVAVDLQGSFSNSSAYIAGQQYVFSFDYRTDSTLNMYYVPEWTEGDDPSLDDAYKYYGYGGTDGTTDDLSVDNRNTFPILDPSLAESTNVNVFTAQNDSVSDSDSDTLAFASDGSQRAYFDNFQVIRDSQGDFDLRLKLKLDIDHNDDLDIIPGYYRFSVWVKADTSLSNNSFAADRVELTIRSFDDDNQIEPNDAQVFYSTQALHDLYSASGEDWQGDWSSQWVELMLESDETYQVPNISKDPVMEITISPSNPGSEDAGWNRLSPGSILISEPKLEYSSKSW